MEKELSQLVDELNESILKEDFIDIAYNVIEKIEEREDAFDAIDSILMLMERNPNVDFGTPGPLVHFAERFYKNGYEEKLVDSLKRCPTKHTVWMLNRIINGSQGDKKKYFINVLRDVIVFPNLNNEVISLANHFKSLLK
jgi:hypothetical protein